MWTLLTLPFKNHIVFMHEICKLGLYEINRLAIEHNGSLKWSFWPLKFNWNMHYKLDFIFHFWWIYPISPILCIVTCLSINISKEKSQLENQGHSLLKGLCSQGEWRVTRYTVHKYGFKSYILKQYTHIRWLPCSANCFCIYHERHERAASVLQNLLSNVFSIVSLF